MDVPKRQALIGLIDPQSGLGFELRRLHAVPHRRALHHVLGTAVGGGEVRDPPSAEGEGNRQLIQNMV